MEFADESMEIVRKYRKTEPWALVGTRAVVLLVCMLACLGYLAILIFFLVDTDYVDVNTIVPTPKIPVPDLKISFDYRFNMTCQFRYLNSTQSDINVCEKYIRQPCTNKTDQTMYEAYFTSPDYFDPKDQLQFNVDEQFYGIWFSIYIDDLSYDEEKDLGMFVRAYDSALNPLTINSYVNKTIRWIDPDFYNKLENLNFHVLGFRQANWMFFNRLVKRKIWPSWLNVIGIPPKHFDMHYLSTTFESVSNPLYELSTERKRQLYSNLFVGTVNWFTETNAEIKTRTLLDAFGLISGFYALCVGVYICCFGVSPVLPWGLCQNCCMRRQIKENLRKEFPKYIPLVDPTSPDVTLDQRVSYLEKFLNDYVVDVDYMREVEDGAHGDGDGDSGGSEEKQDDGAGLGAGLGRGSDAIRNIANRRTGQQNPASVNEAGEVQEHEVADAPPRQDPPQRVPSVRASGPGVDDYLAEGTADDQLQGTGQGEPGYDLGDETNYQIDDTVAAVPGSSHGTTQDTPTSGDKVPVIVYTAKPSGTRKRKHDDEPADIVEADVRAVPASDTSKSAGKKPAHASAQTSHSASGSPAVAAKSSSTKRPRLTMPKWRNGLNALANVALAIARPRRNTDKTKSSPHSSSATFPSSSQGAPRPETQVISVGEPGEGHHGRTATGGYAPSSLLQPPPSPHQQRSSTSNREIDDYTGWVPAESPTRVQSTADITTLKPSTATERDRRGSGTSGTKSIVSIVDEHGRKIDPELLKAENRVSNAPSSASVVSIVVDETGKEIDPALLESGDYEVVEETVEEDVAEKDVAEEDVEE